jgi:thioredoxin 1
MRKTLIAVAVMSIGLVLGCGKEPEDEVAASRVEQEVGSEEESGQARTTEAGRPVDVSDDSFQSEVLEADLPVLVDFWAPWCRPCLISAPVLESIAQEYKGKLKVCKLNVDQARQTAMKYGIMSIPTLILYKDGQAVDKVVGVLPDYEAELKRKIDSHL